MYLFIKLVFFKKKIEKTYTVIYNRTTTTYTYVLVTSNLSMLLKQLVLQ